MNELNISSILLKCRKEKGVTQEAVASYVGVSKASVSKWEKGVSYPDITLLPLLANYFQISIDELIGYRPQLEDQEIWRLYREFSEKFTLRPFEEAVKETREYQRKYDACHPFLFALAQLYLNYSVNAPSKEQGEQLLAEAEHFCKRIQKESKDTLLKKDALSMEAFIHLLNKKPERALELLGSRIRAKLPSEQLMIQAYQMLGEKERAMGMLQGILYQNLVETMDYLGTYIDLSEEENKKEEGIQRLQDFLRIFSLKQLIPHKTMGIYLYFALFYAERKNKEKVVHWLEEFTELIEQEKEHFTIHGDFFFDRMEKALLEMGLGNQLPRSSEIIRREILPAVAENPAFYFLKEDPRYLNIIKRIKTALEKEAYGE